MRVHIPRPIVVMYCSVAAIAFGWIFVFQQFIDAMSPRVLPRFLNGPIASTPPCNTPDCDFSMFWPAGRLARAGHAAQIYDPAVFQLWREHILFAAVQRLDWFYPPPSLLPVMAISYLPFKAAFLVWTAALTATAALILSRAGLEWRIILLGFLSPAALWNIEMGQLDLICGACLITGLLAAGRAPSRAGAILGLLVLKPQLGLLAPVALLARANWRALLAGAATVAVLLLAVTILLGRPLWAAYLTDGLPTARRTLTAARAVGSERGVSVFWMMRSLGFSVTLAYALQFSAAVAAAAAVWFIWRRPDVSALDRAAITISLSLLATPYGYVNDMAPWSICLVALARRRNWRIDPLDGLFWLWPALCPIVTDAGGVLYTPLVVLAATLRMWRRALPSAHHLPRQTPVLPRAR